MQTRKDHLTASGAFSKVGWTGRPIQNSRHKKNPAEAGFFKKVKPYAASATWVSDVPVS